MRPATNTSRKQLVIFLVVCFGLCFAMGVPLGLAHARGLETGAFPIAQMLYPAAGVMLAALVTRRDDAMLPRRFFVGFLVLTGPKPAKNGKLPLRRSPRAAAFTARCCACALLWTYVDKVRIISLST